MELCQRSSGQPATEMTATEQFLSETLSRIFEASNIALVGFGIIHDLSKLAFSYPHMPCFARFESVIDFQLVARIYLGVESKKCQHWSLQAVVATMLKKRLDKTEQCSDWAARPLRLSQTCYAAIDAATPRYLLEEAFRKKEFGFEFFRRNPNLRQSVRMAFLGTPKMEHDNSIRFRVDMGTEKTMFGIRLAKQIWPTGKEAPPPPSLLPAVSLNQNEERKSNKSKRDRLLRARSIPLRNLAGSLETLPPPGVCMGYTKDSCAEAVLGDDAANSIAEDFTIRFNRRGGIVEMSNCWLLFINFSGHTKEWKYCNQFTEQGRHINFSVDVQRGFKDNELPFLFDIGCLNDLLEYVPKARQERDILLFARSSTNCKFIFCGKCNCVGWTGLKGVYDVLLELLQYEELMASIESPFRRMVEEEARKETENTLSWEIVG
jgi:3'-5' exonuclease